MSLRSTALPTESLKIEHDYDLVDPQVKLPEATLRHSEIMSRSMATKFAALTKDLPIKLTSITKLERDGSNFQHWEVDFQAYIAFAPDIAGYLSDEMEPGVEGYKEDFAEVVNSIIHWTIDRELALSLQDIPHPAGRIAELRKQFSGVSFTARQAGLKVLTSKTYDAKAGTLDEHLMSMRSSRDKMKRIGVKIPDDVFALILANSMPPSFPDVSTSFKGRLLRDPDTVISTSDVARSLGAADVAHRRREMSSEVMKVSLPQDNRPETRRCNYCYIRGHLRADCRKRLAGEKKGQGSKDASSSKNVQAKEVEAEMAGVGFEAWDEPSEVTVSNINLDLETDDGVFDTGATHDVFNSPDHFISIKEIEPIKLTLADGSAKSVITAVGSVRVESPFDSSKSCVRH